MAEKIKAPRGTFDVLPGDSELRGRVFEVVGGTLARAGFGRIETPAFEHTELFVRSVGEATDIVSKEMFTFTDQGERELTLRPEGTAPVARAYLEHGMQKLAQPVKLWYWGPYFRHERPQAGRYRQFHQFGIETIGSDDPAADAEAILLLNEILGELGVPGVRLRIGSLASPATRAAYRDELREYLRSHESDLSPEVRDRLDLNPLRAFDADDPGTAAVMEGAPLLLDRLDDEDSAHFEAVKRLLSQSGVEFELDGTLVRGLDYYTRTVFEFTSDELGAQSALGGGGRYDGLVAELGGADTPAVGFAAGIERILLALAAEPTAPSIDVFVVSGEGERDAAFALVTELRQGGLSAELDLAGRSAKGQMKQADRLGAARTVILDGEMATVRDMATGDQQELDRAGAAAALRGTTPATSSPAAPGVPGERGGDAE